VPPEPDRGVADLQTWSGLTRLREVVESLRSELFDLPDAPRPDPDVPAPPRFLYDFDNLLLSHADRSRVVTDEHRAQLYGPDHPNPAAFLIDGRTAGEWRIARERNRATLRIRPYLPLAPADERALTEEGAGPLAFVAPAVGHDIRVLPLSGEPL
jgi:hypothetical protein